MRETGWREMLDRAIGVVHEHVADRPLRLKLVALLRREHDDLRKPRCKVTLEGSFYKCGTFGQYCSEECWNRGKKKDAGPDK